MFRKNPAVNCPSCGTGNKANRWQCWSCKSELSESGGAAAPWADTGTVFGGKMRARAGTSSYWRNPLIPYEFGKEIAENIFNVNPDSVESMVGEPMDMDSSMSWLRRNPRRKRRNPRRRRNSAPVWGRRRNPRRSLFRRNTFPLGNENVIYHCPGDCGSGAKAPLDSHPASCKLRQEKEAGKRRNPLYRRRLRRNPTWGGSLFRRNPAMTARWSPCSGCGMASCGCGCGGDESRCSCGGMGSSRRLRRNSAPAWGGPLFRRNPEDCPACECAPCECRELEDLGTHLLAGGSRRNPFFRRNPENCPECPACECAPCECPECPSCECAPCKCAPGSVEARRRNTWSGPLFRRNPGEGVWECCNCGDDLHEDQQGEEWNLLSDAAANITEKKIGRGEQGYAMCESCLNEAGLDLQDAVQHELHEHCGGCGESGEECTCREGEECSECFAEDRVNESTGVCAWCQAQKDGSPWGRCDLCDGSKAADGTCACRPPGRRRNSDAWGGPLFRRNPASRYRRNG